MRDMSAYLTTEVLLFAKAFWNGACLLLIYDVFRILRGVIRHGKILTALEDVGYWIFCAFYLLGYFYRENSGELRGYLFAGVLLGALACHASISRLFVALGTRLLKVCGKILGVPLKKIKKGIKRLKFRMFRFKIYWYSKFYGQEALRADGRQDKERKHEKRKKQKQPKSSPSQTEQTDYAGDYGGGVRSDGGDSRAGTETEQQAGCQ